MQLDQILRFCTENSARLLEDSIESCISHGLTFDLELEHRKENSPGTIAWTRVIGRAEMENGKVKRLFGTVQDITDYKRH